MTFADQISSACGTIAAAMGESVTHTAAADDTETVIAAATFAEQKPETADSRDGRQTIRRATCTFPAASLAAPVRTDTITRGGVDWTIETDPLAVGGGDYWQTDLKRTVAIEATRQGHRLER